MEFDSLDEAGVALPTGCSSAPSMTVEDGDTISAAVTKPSAVDCASAEAGGGFGFFPLAEAGMAIATASAAEAKAM